VPDPENRSSPDAETMPDLEATRSIRQSELEARLLHEALLDACRTPDGPPLADDEATRMVHVGPGDEDTTNLEHAAVRLGDEETTTEDASPALSDEATPLTVAAPIDEASAIETGPTLEVAAPDTLVDHPPVPQILPTARAPLVATRPRRSPPPAAGNPSPVVEPAAQRTSRRPHFPRRDVLVLVLLALIVIALFWAAATVPTGASPPPRSSAPRSGIDRLLSSAPMARRPRIRTSQRRARLAIRHCLAASARVTDPLDAARGVVCLHATDPASVYLSAWARLASPSLAVIDRALYDERSLIRMLAMRRTMFVVPRDEAPILQAAASAAVAARERRRNEEIVQRLGVRNPRRWLRDAEAAALAALERRGEATAVELARDVPALARKLRVNLGKKYEADIGMAPRVLLVLAAEARVVRARPRGTWISSQYRWSTMERWIGAPLAAPPAEDARAELVRRWLARFGPGTEADLQWWTGWPLRDVRAALARTGAVEVDLDDGSGLVLPDDLEPVSAVAPWIALLPSLDATTMGWQARDWYLGEHRAALFDRNGNAGPTIWADGRVVGGWAVRAGGQVVTRLLEDAGRRVERAVAAEAARLTAWLAGTGVVPRFATPLARELTTA
jgi:hypothetical protein